MEQNHDFFPYGTQYHRAPTPLPSEWEGDFRELAKAGYTHVQFRPQWRCHERIRGKYDWTELEQLCDAAHRHGLKVIIKSQLETAPDWVFDELEGTRVGFGNRELPPIAHAAFYVGGWWPCFDGEPVRQAAFQYNKALASHFKDHPALWFFNAWNEPRSRPMGDCQCRHSIASYREWLREKFGTIEALNAFFGKSWTGFDTIRPPQSYSDYAELILWRQWAEYAVARKVRLSYEGLKAGAPDKTVMCHVGFSSVTQDPMCDTSNDLLNAAQVDFYGCSFPVSLYPANAVQEHDPLYHSAWMRRVDPHYWIQEFYPNFANWLENPDTRKVVQTVWMALAAGCNGFTFWQYRAERLGEESNCSGVRNMDGSPNECSIELEKIGRWLRQYGPDLHATKPERSPIGVLYHRRNDMLMRTQTMNCDLPDIATIRGSVDYSFRRALQNAMTIWRLHGYGCEFVTPEDDFSAFRILHVSCVELVDSLLAEKLREFTARGGVLFIEYPFACRDENLWVSLKRPNHDLSELTGVTEGLRTVLKSASGGTFADCIGATGNGWKVELVPAAPDLEVWKNWADHPGVEQAYHPYRKGHVVTSGANVSALWDGRFGAGTDFTLYRRILALAGLPAGTAPETWELIRSNDSCRFRFVFHLGEKPARFELQPGERPTWIYEGDEARQTLNRYGCVVLVKK